MHILYYQLAGISVGISLGIGLLLKWVLDKTESDLEITRREYVGGALATVVLAALTVFVGWQLAKANLLSFNENINLYVEGVQLAETPCSLDGPCEHSYKCDPYPCRPHDCPPCVCTSRDSKGNCTSESCQTCWDTCYHQCPYVSKELDAVVLTSGDGWLGGPVVLRESLFPDNPQTHRWRPNKEIPQSVIDRAGTVPQSLPQLYWYFYEQVQGGGVVPPIVRRNQYDHYILAANMVALEEYEDDIQFLIDNGLMPTLQTGLTGDHQANRIYFVPAGYTPPDPEVWQKELHHFDTALGESRQGDLHLVIMQARGYDLDPDRTTQAIKCDWQDKEKRGDNAFAKNGILVVVATNDSENVAWARATTGMPEGDAVPVDYNADMRESIAAGFQGQRIPLRPETVLGTVRTYYKKDAVPCDFYYCKREVGEVVHGNGVLEKVVFGLENGEVGFQRISMTAKDPEDFGPGFLELDKLIVPTKGQRVAIIIGAVFASMIAWSFVTISGYRYRSRFYY